MRDSLTMPSAGDISARIDRLPPTRAIWTAILLLSFGMFFELYDILFSGYIAPSLVKSGLLTATTPGLFGATGVASFIAALLSTLLGLDRLFQADADDGSLDVLVNAALPLELVVAVKCAAHWVSNALPLILASPLFGLMLAMDARALLAVGASLIAGTPALTMIGAIGAALTVSLRRGGLLMAVLVLPLSIPVLIFGVSAASAASGGAAPFWTPFLMLCAISLFAIAAAPFAAAAALRLGRE